MAAIDIYSKALSILAGVITCVDHALGNANFTGTTTIVIDAVDQLVPLTTDDTPAVLPVSDEDLENLQRSQPCVIVRYQKILPILYPATGKISSVRYIVS